MTEASLSPAMAALTEACSSPALATLLPPVYLPQNVQHALQACKTMFQSGLLPSHVRTPEAALLMTARANLFGMDPSLFMENTYMQNGIITFKIHMIQGVLAQAGVRWKELELTPVKCVVEFERAGWPNHVETFDEDDTRRMNLANNAAYKSYPKMLVRAQAFRRGAYFIAADLLRGLAIGDPQADAEAPGSPAGGVEAPETSLASAPSRKRAQKAKETTNEFIDAEEAAEKQEVTAPRANAPVDGRIPTSPPVADVRGPRGAQDDAEPVSGGGRIPEPHRDGAPTQAAGPGATVGDLLISEITQTYSNDAPSAMQALGEAFTNRLITKEQYEQAIQKYRVSQVQPGPQQAASSSRGDGAPPGVEQRGTEVGREGSAASGEGRHADSGSGGRPGSVPNDSSGGAGGQNRDRADGFDPLNADHRKWLIGYFNQKEVPPRWRNTHGDKLKESLKKLGHPVGSDAFKGAVDYALREWQ